MSSWYKYPIVTKVFSHPGFWSGNLFLIAPFHDICLHVPFSTSTLPTPKTSMLLDVVEMRFTGVYSLIFVFVLNVDCGYS